ncbi:hypothetical protein Bca52824_096818, partial [Brassica carinata]
MNKQTKLEKNPELENSRWRIQIDTHRSDSIHRGALFSEIGFSENKMGSLGTFLRYPDDIYPLLKMKRAIERAEKQIPPEPHWAFCYSMLHKVSRSFSLVIQQLGTELRNAVCVFYLVLRALDT